MTNVNHLTDKQRAVYIARLEAAVNAMSTITIVGDVAGTGTGSVTVSIPADTVTYAKMQNVSATDKVLGRSTAGAGDVEEIPCTATGRSIIAGANILAVRNTLGVGYVLYSATGGTTTTIPPGAGVKTYLNLNFTIPAGTMNTVGKLLRITSDNLVRGTAGNTTTTIDLNVGTTSISTSAVGGTSTTNAQWQYQWIIRTETTGATGTISCTCINNMNRANTVAQVTQTTGTVVDLTNDILVQMSVTFTTAGATNSMQQTLFMAEMLN